MTVSDDVAQKIAADVLDLTYGQNIRPGPITKPSQNQTVTGAIPEECVFVLDNGGPIDLPYIDGGNRTGENYSNVSVFIRSKVNDYDGGKALADTTRSAIDKNPPAGYFEARAQTSQAIYVQKNETQHHEFTFDVILKKTV